VAFPNAAGAREPPRNGGAAAFASGGGDPRCEARSLVAISAAVPRPRPCYGVTVASVAESKRGPS